MAAGHGGTLSFSKATTGSYNGKQKINVTGKKISKVRSSSGAVLGQKWPPLGLSCRTYIFIPIHIYKHVFRFKAGDECLQSSLGTTTRTGPQLGATATRPHRTAVTARWQQEIPPWTLINNVFLYKYKDIRFFSIAHDCHYYLPRFFF